MKKTLLTTSALAFAGAVAVGSASAADQLSVGLSGSMEQWVGMTSVEEGDGGFAQQSDTEFHIKGALEADNGLTFSVKIEVKGNGNASGGANIDESQATVTGSFGQIMLGAEDNVVPAMHYGNGDVGIGLNHGDVGNWIDGVDVGGTNGWIGDKKTITYYSPRISGVQFGASYIPDMDNGRGGNVAPMGNEDDAWSVALNVDQSVGDASVKFSVGHYIQSSDALFDFNSSVDGQQNYRPWAGEGDGALTRGQHAALAALWDAYEMGLEDGFMSMGGDLLSHGANSANRKPMNYDLPNPFYDSMSDETTVESNGIVFDNIQNFNSMRRIVSNAYAARARLEQEPYRTVVMPVGDTTTTNVGLNVGFGAFGFDVAHAIYDGPATYRGVWDYKVVTDEDHMFEGDDGTMIMETEDNNDPMNDIRRGRAVMTDTGDSTVTSAGINYADGPMAASLSYMTRDRDNGMDASAVMASFRYTLAPGVESRTSIFQAEDDSSGAEGTGFVTGIKIGF